MAQPGARLTRLKKKQQMELEAKNPPLVEEPKTPHYYSLAQCIYTDNRRKAEVSHNMLSHLGPPVSWPLYNCPQDTAVYYENIRKHDLFRKRLAEHIRRYKLAQRAGAQAEARQSAPTEAATTPRTRQTRPRKPRTESLRRSPRARASRPDYSSARCG